MTAKLTCVTFCLLTMLGCADIQLNRKYAVSVSLLSENDTLTYEVSYIDPKSHDYKEHFKIYNHDSKDLLVAQERVYVRNNSTKYKKNKICTLKNGKYLDSCDIRGLYFNLLFEFPEEEVYEKYEWSFNSPYDFSNLNNEDYTSSAKGIVEKIEIIDSATTNIHLRYSIEASRDIDLGSYPNQPKNLGIAIKDYRKIKLEGVFVKANDFGFWKSVKIVQHVKTEAPKVSVNERTVEINLISGAPPQE